MYYPTLIRLLFLGALLLPLAGYAQSAEVIISRFGTYPEAKSSGAKKQLRVALRAGLELDEASLRKGGIVVTTSDFELIRKGLRGWGQTWRWEATREQGDTETLLIRRRATREQLREQYSHYLKTHLPPRMRRASPEAQQAYVEQEMKKFPLVLWGWKKKRFDKNYRWFVYLGDTSPEGIVDYRVDFYTGWKPYGLLLADTLQAGVAHRLPGMDSANCQAINRRTRFAEFQRVTFQAFPYYPYTLPERRRRTRNFTLMFEKNGVGYSEAEVNEIVRFVADSSYTIAKAYVRGMASVEGDSANNIRLMEARAQVLLNTLQAAQSDSIALETETYENWPLFNKQLVELEIDTALYSKAEWKELFFQDSIATVLEPHLAEQRRADLRLFLYQELDRNQQWDWFARDYRYTLVQLMRAPNPRAKGPLLRKLVGMRETAEFYYQEADITWEFLTEIAPILGYAPELTIAYAYHLAQKRAYGRWVPDNFGGVMLSAHYAGLRGMADPTNPGLQDFFAQQTIALQAYIFELLIQGDIDASRLCELAYPESARYYALILNYYHFVEGVGGYVLRRAGCGPQGALSVAGKDIWVSRAPQDSIQAANLDPRHSRYYYFLKRWVLTKDEEIAKYVNRIGDFYHFDLMEVVYYNVRGWQVMNQQMFDEEIPLKVLHALVSELLTYRDKMCPNDLNQLVLDYHLKVQQAALLGKDTVPPVILGESVEWVVAYYQQHKSKLTPELAQLVSRHVLSMAPFFNGSWLASNAFDFMQAARTEAAIRGPWGREYAQLAAMGGDHLSRLIPGLIEQAGPAADAWEVGYRQVHPRIWQEHKE